MAKARIYEWSSLALLPPCLNLTGKKNVFNIEHQISILFSSNVCIDLFKRLQYFFKVSN